MRWPPFVGGDSCDASYRAVHDNQLLTAPKTRNRLSNVALLEQRNGRAGGACVSRTVKRVVARTARPVKVAVGIVVAGLALTPLAWQLYEHWPEVQPYLRQVRPSPLVAAVALAVLGLGVLASVWVMIAVTLGITLGCARDFRAFFLSSVLKRVPGAVWYFVGRAYLYRGATGGAWMATTGTVLENALLLFTGLALALIVWPAQLGWDTRWGLGALVVSALLVLGLSLRPTAAVQLLRPLWGRDCQPSSTVRTPRVTTGSVLSWIALYAVSWGVGGCSLHFFVAAFYPSLSLHTLPFTVGVGIVYTLTGFVAFFVPAGLGVKELAAVYLLRHVMPLPLAAIVVLLFRLNLLLAEALWLVVSYSLVRWPVPLFESARRRIGGNDESI